MSEETDRIISIRMNRCIKTARGLLTFPDCDEPDVIAIAKVAIELYREGYGTK